MAKFLLAFFAWFHVTVRGHTLSLPPGFSQTPPATRSDARHSRPVAALASRKDFVSKLHNNHSSFLPYDQQSLVRNISNTSKISEEDLMQPHETEKPIKAIYAHQYLRASNHPYDLHFSKLVEVTDACTKFVLE